MKDFLNFKKIITPLIVSKLFSIGAILCIIIGIYGIGEGISFLFGSSASGMDAFGMQVIIIGLAYLILGPIILRIFCEVLITVFSINDTLTDIKKQLNRQQDQDDQTNSHNEG